MRLAVGQNGGDCVHGDLLACFSKRALPGQEEVIIVHAGSLTNALKPLERAFVCQTGVHVIDCQGGSLDLVRARTGIP